MVDESSGTTDEGYVIELEEQPRGNN